MNQFNKGDEVVISMTSSKEKVNSTVGCYDMIAARDGQRGVVIQRDEGGVRIEVEFEDDYRWWYLSDDLRHAWDNFDLEKYKNL